MLKAGDIAIVSGARTPFGRYCGKLKDFTAQELGAIAGKGAIERSGIDPKEFDHVVFGNAQQTSGDALYGARHVGLRAGLPIETPALTVNRLCGSGMQAIVNAAQMIQTDEAKVVLAGGMEAMSQAPFVIRGRDGFTLAPGGKLEDSLMVALLDSYCGSYMANTAELYGSQHGIDRQMQDEFALRSQQRADAAYKEGRIQEELVPVPLRNHKGEPSGESLTEDDHRRPQTTMEGLAKLKPAFGKSGTVTAGNASGIVDGAAAVVVMSLDEVRKRNMEPLGRIVSWGVAGVDPKVMGRGPVPATKIALQKAGLSLDYIDLIEVNEAFAAQYLAVEKELGTRSREGECERRGDCVGASAGSDGDTAGDHASIRVASKTQEVRTGVGVHRRRAGNRDGRGVYELGFPWASLLRHFKTTSFTTEDTGVHRVEPTTGSWCFEMMTSTCSRLRVVSVVNLLLVFFLFVSALLAQSPVMIRVDASKSMGPLHRVWEYFGYDEPNYTYTAHGKELIRELVAMSPGKVQIRTHNLLTTGDGTPALKWGSTNAYTEDAAGRPVYDWKIVDQILDTYLQAGAKPFVEIGFMPEALSVHPEPYRHHWPKDELYSGWAYPPRDFKKWAELVHQMVRALYRESTERKRSATGIGKCGTSRISDTGTERRKSTTSFMTTAWRRCGARCRKRM